MRFQLIPDLSRFRIWLFETGDARVPAGLRVSWCLLYLYVFWDLHPVLDTVLGKRGVYGTMDLIPIPSPGPLSWLWFHDLPHQLQAWWWFAVVIGILGLLGVCSRLFVALMIWTLLTFYSRNPFITYGADNLMLVVGVWIAIADSDQAWSVQSLLREESRAEVALWPVKMIQMQMAIIYVITGLCKFDNSFWLDGSAVYYAVQLREQNTEFFLPYGALTTKWIYPFLTYGTLIVECGLPFAFFSRKYRLPFLLAGILMHAGISIVMSIRFFSEAVFVGYLAFVTSEDLAWLEAKLSMLRRVTVPPRTREYS